MAVPVPSRNKRLPRNQQVNPAPNRPTGTADTATLEQARGAQTGAVGTTANGVKAPTAKTQVATQRPQGQPVQPGSNSQLQPFTNDGSNSVYTRNVRLGGSRAETVEGRLNRLLSKNNPYMKQAALAGRQMGTERGLGGSTLQAKAVEAARIQAALPIAQQDASTLFNQGLNNQNAINQSSLQEMLARIQAETSLAGANISAGATLGAAGISAESSRLNNIASITAAINTNPSLSNEQKIAGVNTINTIYGRPQTQQTYANLPPRTNNVPPTNGGSTVNNNASEK